MTTKQKFKVDRTLFPFESKYMRMQNGAAVHYVDEGEGEITFLMLHGNPTWSFVYRKLIRRLSKQYRCVAPDYPGFGLSTAPEGYDFKAYTQFESMVEFVERLGLKNVILVTQDWGGPIGFALAARFPHLVDKVIAGNTWAWPMTQDRRFRTFSAIMGGPFGRTIARLFNGVWRFFMLRGFVNHPSKAEMAMYAAPFHGGDNWRQTAVFPRELVRAVELETLAEQGFNQLRDKPILLLWGTEDFGFQENELARFEATFANRHTVLLNASHFWQDDQGETAVVEIEKWVAQLEPQKELMTT